jgi:hypothetical protein
MLTTAAQYQTLKAALAANTATVLINGASTPINAVPVGAQNAQTVADWYNLTAAPAFVLWKGNVAIKAVGEAFNAGELGGLTSLNTQRLQNLAAWLTGGVNPSLASVRQFFDDVFSGAGGVNTRAALLALWKRNATWAEKLYAAGAGTDAAPAVSAFADGSLLTPADVLGAWAA